MKTIKGYITGSFFKSGGRVGTFVATARQRPSRGGVVSRPATLTVGESVQPDGMKQVFQWRYRNAGHRHWKIANTLATEDQIMEWYNDPTTEIEKHAGPFWVTE